MNEDPDLIALAVSRDQRFAVLQQAIAVEADMRDNPTIRALTAAIRADAELAMAELAEISPVDTKAISLIAIRVKAYTSLKRYIEAILTRGKIAEQDIRMQDGQFGDENDPTG
jgi:hypothetical protein